jgi:anaerobic ribonucleoside-triphosphate reductase
MEVYKSTKVLEEYSEEKIKNGICEAYTSAGEECQDDVISAIVSNLYVYNKISTKEIRRQVEESLMSMNKKVARAYMEKYSDIKEIRKKDSFINDYINASNASTGSKYDSNANVSNKNIVTMGQELPKLSNIKQNRYILQNKIKSLYTKKLADQYVKDIESHVLYKHDETAIPGMPYCVAITMYPFLIDGLTTIGGQSKHPTDLKSFCGEFINLVYSISSQFAGAVATPEYLMYMDYFIRKDYGDDYLEKLNERVELTSKGRTLEQVIENAFQQVVHSMNMPAGNRGYQTVFWNVGYFDKSYFEGVFGDFVFPDGTKPIWETLSWLQKKFMKWFNSEREKYILTFPVETMAMLTDGNDIVDKEYGDFTAEMWAEGHSFFCYLSDSPDSLSSCCFGKNQKTLTRSSVNGINFMTFEELYKAKYRETKLNFKIFHNGSWVDGNIIKIPNRNMFKILTSNNKEIIVSDNHLNPIIDGEKRTDELTTEDYLLFNNMALDTFPEKDEKLTYEMGFAVGAFIGDGSFDKEIKGTIYVTNYSQNKDKYEETIKNVNKAVEQLGRKDAHCNLGKIYNNVYPITISCKELTEFITRWTLWERGTFAFNKKLNLDCLLQSIEFRKGILDGWYNTDGGNSNRCYTTSSELAEDMEVLITSLGLNSIIDMVDKTDEKVIIRGSEWNRNYPLYCVRWYNAMNKRSMKDVYKIKNNSIYFKIKAIEKLDYKNDIYCFQMKNEEEPYFTLPNGIITHNCRLRNSLKDLQDDEHNHTTHQFSMGTASVATGSKSVMTMNLNRLVQNAVEKCNSENKISVNFKHGDKFILNSENKEIIYSYIEEEIKGMTSKIHKYQKAFNETIKDFLKAKMLPVYDAGYIDMKKQYLTVGVNGLTDAAEFLGIDAKPSEEYNEFVNLILEAINKCNAEDRTKETMYNTEFVPGENLSCKNYNWDKKDGYYVSPKHIMYSSYFFNPEDDSLSVIDKMKLHGKDYVKYLDGGSANHTNLQEHLSFEQYRQLLKIAAREGCNYFTFNVRNTVCNDCGYISKDTLDVCPKCGSKNLDYLTRIIGYLKRVSSFSEPRQEEEHMRSYING